VLDGDLAPPERGTAPHFLAHVYCGQMAGWIKMALGTEVYLGPGHIVFMGPSSPERGTAAPPSFWPMYIVAIRLPISATAELLLQLLH